MYQARKKMAKLTEWIDQVEDKNFEIVETKNENVLVSYKVTYSYGGKSLSESVDVAGLSKRTTNKKLTETKKKLKRDIRYVTETWKNPGTDVIRNDFGQQLLPLGFASDCTLLSPQEISDAATHMSRYSSELIVKYIHQIEDDVGTCEKLDQKNRVADLKIRLAIANLALKIAETQGHKVYSDKPGNP